MTLLNDRVILVNVDTYIYSQKYLRYQMVSFFSCGPNRGFVWARMAINQLRGKQIMNSIVIHIHKRASNEHSIGL